MPILNLPEYKILETKESDNNINILLEPLHIQINCKYCNFLNIRKKGTTKQFYFDIPIRNKRVGLTIKVQRYFCEDCKKTFQNNLPQISDTRSITIRLLEHIQKQSLIKPFTHLANETGMSEGNIRKIFKSYTDDLKARYTFETPKVFGIDEIHLAGRPRAVMTNIEERTIIEMFKDRNKDTILKYLRSLANKDNIINVTIDMWRPYKDAVNTVLPNAIIVIDKFHVLKMANEALEMYRKELRKSLLPKQRNDLKNDIFILLKRKHKLSDEEQFILYFWKNNYGTLAKMYDLKEQFLNIYEANTKEEAHKLYEQFEVSLTSDIKHYFKDLIRAMSNWHNEIFNYFNYPVANTYTEAVNSVIRQVSRMGRSYSFETIRAKILYSTKAHKNKPKFNKKNDVNLGVDILELSKNIENNKISFSKLDILISFDFKISTCVLAVYCDP